MGARRNWGLIYCSVASIVVTVLVHIFGGDYSLAIMSALVAVSVPTIILGMWQDRAEQREEPDNEWQERVLEMASESANFDVWVFLPDGSMEHNGNPETEEIFLNTLNAIDRVQAASDMAALRQGTEFKSTYRSCNDSGVLMHVCGRTDMDYEPPVIIMIAMPIRISDYTENLTEKLEQQSMEIERLSNGSQFLLDFMTFSKNCGSVEKLFSFVENGLRSVMDFNGMDLIIPDICGDAYVYGTHGIFDSSLDMEKFLQSLSDGEGLDFSVMLEGQSFISQDVEADDIAESMTRPMRCPKGSILVLPMQASDGTSWGVISLDSCKKKGFNMTDLTFARILACTLASYFDLMNSYGGMEKMQESLEQKEVELNLVKERPGMFIEMLAELKSFYSLDGVMPGLRASIMSLVHHNRTALFIPDLLGTPWLYNSDPNTPDEEFIRVARQNISEGVGICNSVISARMSFITNNAGADPLWLPHGSVWQGTKSLMAIPIVSEPENVHAVLMLGSDSEDAFTPADLQLVEMAARNIALYLGEYINRDRQRRTLEDLSEKTSDLETLTEKQQHILDLFTSFRHFDSLKSLMPTLEANLRTLIPCHKILISVPDIFGKPYAYDTDGTDSEDPRMAAYMEMMASGSTICSMVQSDGVPFRSGDLDKSCAERSGLWEKDAMSVVIVPISASANLKIWGTISLYSEKTDAFGSNDIQMLEMVAAYMALCADEYANRREMEDLLSQREREALIDPLSGLWNRRSMEGRIAEEVARAERYGTKITVVAMDMHNFKNINDVFGHAMGDEAIKTTAKIIKSRLRKTDYIARAGGDEFYSLVINTSDDDCTRIFESICDDLENRNLFGRSAVTDKIEKIRLQLDYGFCSWPGDDAPTIDEAMEIADKRMYIAKKKRKLQNYPEA